MNGEAIGAQALGHSGLRVLASEYGGPRPGGVRVRETTREPAERRVARATRP